ncbi:MULTISPECIES: hypothetical protein [unclassified Rhodococcus (in: high G+C Gram-positive bacteria)]|uniref:hypothetical protein n=1 Tax=unclassified Rhodococcus (in: high G+C Gram-positive bacteria) TaxID=192944 RepID=UPI0005DB969D|nr:MULTISPECIES: hypothetical protein [unclassified Rhodococcus (in: high G+C Gram-positive bacteria)]KJF25090.1 hypothetical protein SZ00_02016 [Rhodococcus sp. AD45]
MSGSSKSNSDEQVLTGAGTSRIRIAVIPFGKPLWGARFWCEFRSAGYTFEENIEGIEQQLACILDEAVFDTVHTRFPRIDNNIESVRN